MMKRLCFRNFLNYFTDKLPYPPLIYFKYIHTTSISICVDCSINLFLNINYVWPTKRKQNFRLIQLQDLCSVSNKLCAVKMQTAHWPFEFEILRLKINTKIDRFAFVLISLVMSFFSFLSKYLPFVH